MKLSTAVVRDLLDYDQHTGVFTWRDRGRGWFPSDHAWNAWNARLAGKEAGCVGRHKTGYPMLLICVIGRQRMASRLAFLWMGEPLPEQVDHLDGDSLNQAWANLLASTAADNQKNRSMSRTNTSGVCGVSWSKSRGKWYAQGMLGGKKYSLGRFDDLDDAAAVVLEFLAENGYSARHGQEFSPYQIAPDPVQTSMSESAKLEIQ